MFKRKNDDLTWWDHFTSEDQIILIGLLIALAMFCVMALLIALDDCDTQCEQYQNRDAFIQECLQHDTYTRNECITMAGSE